MPGCTRMGCTSLDDRQPDSHKEAMAGRSWASTSTFLHMVLSFSLSRSGCT